MPDHISAFLQMMSPQHDLKLPFCTPYAFHIHCYTSFF